MQNAHTESRHLCTEGAAASMLKTENINLKIQKLKKE